MRPGSRASPWRRCRRPSTRLPGRRGCRRPRSRACRPQLAAAPRGPGRSQPPGRRRARRSALARRRFADDRCGRGNEQEPRRHGHTGHLQHSFSRQRVVWLPIVGLFSRKTASESVKVVAIDQRNPVSAGMTRVTGREAPRRSRVSIFAQTRQARAIGRRNLGSPPGDSRERGARCYGKLRANRGKPCGKPCTTPRHVGPANGQGQAFLGKWLDCTQNRQKKSTETSLSAARRPGGRPVLARCCETSRQGARHPSAGSSASFHVTRTPAGAFRRAQRGLSPRFGWFVACVLRAFAPLPRIEVPNAKTGAPSAKSAKS